MTKTEHDRKRVSGLGFFFVASATDPITYRCSKMSQRRFPSPWSIEDIDGCFVVKASNDRPLIFIYYGEGVGHRSLARLLTRNAARQVAAGIAKLPELLRKP